MIKNKINIGKRKYRVKLVSLIENNPNTLGMIKHNNKTIYIKKENSKVEKDTLFHEIAHGIVVDLAITGYRNGMKKKYFDFFKKLNDSEGFIEYFGKVLQRTFKLK
jgi:hypothetical protein